MSLEFLESQPSFKEPSLVKSSSLLFCNEHDRQTNSCLLFSINMKSLSYLKVDAGRLLVQVADQH